MSANNQILIVRYKDKYLVYDNVPAESWIDIDEEENELDYWAADMLCPDLECAYDYANVCDEEDPTEYGIHVDKLAKDGARVKIIE